LLLLYGTSFANLRDRTDLVGLRCMHVVLLLSLFMQLKISS